MARPPTELVKTFDGEERLDLCRAVLEVTRGPDRGHKCAVRVGGITVGTAVECDLVLTDSTVSRRQFEVRPTPDGFVLADLRSTNGTWVGGLRVNHGVVPAGSKIVVGRTTLLLVARKEREPHLLSPHHRFGSLFGQSAVMRRCFKLLERAADTDSTVLIEGESGTGKELAARSLHEKSQRCDGPFVVVDCGAIAANLIDSELFGHEKGAFTGAVEKHVGAFVRAHGGTLFLDEIGELGLEQQPRLLRFLERREVRTVGGSGEIGVDVRVVAATNRRMEEAVAAGSFREDLFYRLAVIRVDLPPLRSRAEDISILALELARQLRPQVDPSTWLDQGTLEVFASHPWPGNVRELRNVLERLAVLPEFGIETLLGVAARVGSGDLDGSLTQLPYHQAKERLLDSFEKRYLEALLAKEEGVVARAAERAQVPRQTFFRLIRKHNLRGAAETGDDGDAGAGRR